jgi:Holliday junction resolvase RusA-like endonuclease
MNIRYILDGQPIPLQRPRFSNGHVWDCQSKEKLMVSTYLKYLHKNRPLLIGPLELHISFFLKHKVKSCWHFNRPDLDNLIKFYMDCANGVLYEDDKQVVKIIATKVYAQSPHTEIYVNEIDNILRT